MLEVVEEDRVAEEISTGEQLGARAATQFALCSDATTVTARSYRDIIERKYVGDGVVHVPHGTFARADGGVPKTEPPLSILLFGFLGPTKDVETAVAAFRRIRAELPDTELVVAGDSHPDFPKYLASLRDTFGDEERVRFTGYVEEEELDELWRKPRWS
jgi:glycosyltransferase involved in cell wall biosynthesis